MLNVNLKKCHEDAVIPTYAKPGDAGMDLTAVAVEYDKDLGIITYRTGIAIEIPCGYVAHIYPRSSIYKKELILTNSVGVIDSGYRGEILAKFRLDLNYWDGAVTNEDFQDRLEAGKFDFFRTASDAYHDKDSNGLSFQSEVYAVGDRICQIVISPIPQVQFKEVESLPDSERGTGGYGHTGN